MFLATRGPSWLVSLCVLCLCCGAHALGDPALPQAVDCGIRELAYEYAGKITSTRRSSIFDALALSQCNKTFVDPTPHNKFPMHKPMDGALNLYVSPKGNDGGNGSEEQPFRTLHRALLQRRIMALASPITAPMNIYLMRGTYYMGSLGPLVVTPLDGGDATAPVNILPYDTSDVVLSGGVPLEGLAWKKYNAQGVYVAQLPSPLNFTSLFIDGTRMVRARYPNGDPTVPWSGYTNAAKGTPQVPVSGYVVNVSQPFLDQASWPTYMAMAGGPTSRFETFYSPFTESSVPYAFYINASTWTQHTWARPKEAVVHMMHPELWGNWQFTVKSLDTKTGLMNLTMGGWQESRGGAINQNSFYVENVFEELDTPGEWYLDVSGGLLYIMPPAGVDLNNAEIVAPMLNSVIEMRGWPNQPVQYVTIQGVTVTHTATTFFETYEVPSGGDWSIFRGGAVFVDGAANVAVTGCVFDQPGGNGVFLSNSVVYSHVTGNYFAGCGDSAIAVVGTSVLLIGTRATFPAFNNISGNHIHDVGVFGKQTAGYFQGTPASFR
eukprot:TRINITY_DN4960_c0_g1_i1.p1 TRINITY_DN4960_c0_g1~~TRINITY_DN4960_c0_g1_i1.p1  ORF type:complete len:549 (+),score=110.52 TRINITY_DN4960_c0_g1_i1:1-1647(+)